ncbi:MAG: translation initiation factor IF-3 [Anaerolineae bacterium]|nr:translation initiation factor IF-3 [Anaerolineae bacterium]
MSSEKYNINQKIRAKEVRVIDAQGENLGVLPIKDALNAAREAGLDLVEVAPNAEPPVTRIMDYGKFLYRQAKKEREAKRAQKQVEVKEIRLRPKTTDHHLSFKIRDASRWLEDGNKVKVRVRFRGREITYPEVAMEQLKQIAEELVEIAVVEQSPTLDGRTMLMVLAPKKKK